MNHLKYLKYLNKFLDGAVVKHIPMGEIISRIREKGKNNHGVRTVYSVSNTQGLVNAEDFRDNTVHSKDTSNYTIVQPGMFAYNPSRLNIGSIALLKTDTAGLVSPMYVVFSVDKNIVTSDYLDLFIKSSYCKNKIHSLTEEGARFRFDFERWNLINVPVPPIKVQNEIVRILDTFTELTARQQQYAYYRKQLLTFENIEVKWSALEDVVKLQRGKRLIKSQLEMSGDYAVYQNSMKPLGYYHESNVKSDTTFIISAGAAGEVGYSDVDFWAADDVYFLLTPDNINSKFLYYYLLTQQYKILAQVRRASIPRLSRTVIERMQIPIPPLTEQKRIVSILDKFDALTTSLTEGLPREIELRQQQYEYYRDLLLSFPKPEVVAHD